MDNRTRKLAQAVEEFLQDVPHGTPPPVVAGLQNLSKGMRGAPGGQPTPGQQEVALLTGNDGISMPEEEGLTPGQRAAREG